MLGRVRFRYLNIRRAVTMVDRDSFSTGGKVVSN